MKMRIQGNALRFRLSRKEVGEFAASGRASASLDFGAGAKLTYSLVRSAVARGVEAEFSNGEVIVRVPEQAALDWAGTDVVGIDGEQTLEDGDHLVIVVEKDFQCMHKGDEAKDPEAYPNPMATA